MSRVVSPSFRSISAAVHAAPTPVVISTRVVEEISTSPLVGAFAHAFQILRGQQVRGQVQDGPQHAVHPPFLIGPVQRETTG